MRDGSLSQREMIAQCIRDANIEKLPQVMDVIEKTDALDKSITRAQESAADAIACLQVLPLSPYRDALERIAGYSVQRSF